MQALGGEAVVLGDFNARMGSSCQPRTGMHGKQVVTPAGRDAHIARRWNAATYRPLHAQLTRAQGQDMGRGQCSCLPASHPRHVSRRQLHGKRSSAADKIQRNGGGQACGG